MVMKVKDLIEELKNFNEEYFISISGGECADGDWATLTVCKTEEDALFDIGTIVMEYSN